MSKPYLSFVKTVLGEHGHNAIQTAINQMPEIENAVPAQTLLSWVETAARIGYEGIVPGTNHTITIAKSETGYDYSINGSSNSTAHVRDAAIELAVALEFSPDTTPNLNKSQTEQLIKTIDLLAKMSLVKAVGTKPHGAAAPPANPMSQTGPMGATQTQAMKTQKRASALKIPTMAPKTKGAGGTSGGKMSTITPPMAGGQKGIKAAAPKKPPRAAAVQTKKAEQGCPDCGQKAFTSVKFVGCMCFSALAKNTYSKAVEDGYIIFFNFQWDEESINKLIESYKE